jgi:D-sedoheptulose 7-phosphate isomerase
MIRNIDSLCRLVARMDLQMDCIAECLNGVIQALRDLPRAEIASAIEILTQAKANGKQIFVMGNGGSAARASHLACDLGKATVQEEQPRFNILSLNGNAALLAVYANDFGYETTFAEPLISLAESGDGAITINSSGNSPNILRAMDVARACGLTTIGVTGFEGEEPRSKVGVCVVVPDDSQHVDGMQHVEDGQ